jgi:prepilin-type N-terminal cleavage/methylation domain-containing protein
MKLPACLQALTSAPSSGDFSSSRENGFYLVEVLVVMAILGLLMAIGWAGFYGMRKTMILNQNMETLRGNISYAQRSAMLLDRSEDEIWITGIGIDLSRLETDREYTVFKWCGAGDFYEEFDQGALVPQNRREMCDGSGISPVEGKEDIPFLQGDSTEVEYYAETVTGAT